MRGGGEGGRRRANPNRAASEGSLKVYQEYPREERSDEKWSCERSEGEEMLEVVPAVAPLQPSFLRP